jgi:hypothetical protein
MAAKSVAKKIEVTQIEATPAAPDIDVEEALWNVRVALGVAHALSETDDHESLAAYAVVEYLTKARDILQGKEVDHA